jgi:hypothetical protein
VAGQQIEGSEERTSGADDLIQEAVANEISVIHARWLMTTELTEKERPDISVTVDSFAHIRTAVVSGLSFSAQEDGPV